jgi:mono/diheme cytochrome c family protein
MRLRPMLLVLPVIAVALLASGCFESKTVGTVSTPITIGLGTTAEEVNPAGSTSTPTATAPATTGTTSESTSSSTGATSTGTTTGGGAPSYPASAKPTFKTTCGGCHTLADAGTTGTVGPNLDDLKPDEATVAHQIENGGGGMPPGLLKGQALKDVAAYVAAVAGKGGGGGGGGGETDTAVGGAP